MAKQFVWLDIGSYPAHYLVEEDEQGVFVTSAAGHTWNMEDLPKSMQTKIRKALTPIQQSGNISEEEQ